MGAYNFNFAHKFTKNWEFLAASNFAFLTKFSVSVKFKRKDNCLSVATLPIFFHSCWEET